MTEQSTLASSLHLAWVFRTGDGWETGPEMEAHRCQAALVALGSEMVLLGGRTMEGEECRSTAVLDLRALRWRSLDWRAPQCAGIFGFSCVPLL